MRYKRPKRPKPTLFALRSLNAQPEPSEEGEGVPGPVRRKKALGGVSQGGGK